MKIMRTERNSVHGVSDITFRPDQGYRKVTLDDGGILRCHGAEGESLLVHSLEAVSYDAECRSGAKLMATSTFVMG